MLAVSQSDDVIASKLNMIDINHRAKLILENKFKELKARRWYDQFDFNTLDLMSEVALPSYLSEEKVEFLEKNLGNILAIDKNLPTTQYYAICSKIEVVWIDKQTEMVTIKAKPATHYFIYLADNSNATVVFDFEDLSEDSRIGIEIYLSSNSNLKIIANILDASKLKKIILMQAKLEQKAEIDWYINALNTEQLYLDVQSHLVGSKAVSNMNLTFWGKESQIMDIFAGNKFDARECEGVILAKGVAQDKSRISFLGEIDITLNGGGTDSYLKEDVLMLDPTAKIDAIPSLEIKTNDVKAGHGVSISRLTEDKIFYLTSRGISNEEARKLVLAGFLRDLYAKCVVEEVIENLELEIKN